MISILKYSLPGVCASIRCPRRLTNSHRLVTWQARCRSYDRWSTFDGQASSVPMKPSGPGCAASLGSAPPAAGMWQVPQATVSSLESCSSQKSIFPSTRFCSVIGFSDDCGGGVTNCADAMCIKQVRANPTAAQLQCFDMSTPSSLPGRPIDEPRPDVLSPLTCPVECTGHSFPPPLLRRLP